MKMKKILPALLIFLPLVVQAKFKVVTTIPDLAALASEVGGDKIDVESLARGDQDPHYIEPKPSFALKLNRADLLIEIGLQLEIGWLPVLLTQSHNPKIQTGALGHLQASEGLNLLEIPTGPVDRSQGDVHPEGNPHYWLNPRNGLIIAKHIADRLAEIDPANAALYQQNFKSFQARFQKKLTEWEKAISPLKGKKIITYHKSFSYFVNWSGLAVVDQIEPKPGIPPSPSHILALIDRITAEKIPLIITENYYDPRASQKLSQKTGAKVLLLPTSVGGETAIKTYEDLFDYLVTQLKGSGEK